MSEQGGSDIGNTIAGAPRVVTKPVDPLIGQVLDGRYRIEQVLGEGGMGLVYKAVHSTLGKPLAIKVLRPEVSKNEEIVQRFRQEAQSASAIGNQHIIDISDFGMLPDGSTYFVMEYLAGRSLTGALEGDRFPTSRTIHVAKQLCNALGAAHAIGIVHRDLKPDNVQLIDRGNDKDFVKVLDFGIAKVGGQASKLTQVGQVFGTPHYMSPEQCAGTGVDHRTDIYALGVILYEMATGKVPFDADNLMGILTKHLYEKPPALRDLPPPVDVPPALEAVILKALEKKQETRYQTMDELLADLEAIERGLTPKAVMERVDRNTNGGEASNMANAGRVTMGTGISDTIPGQSKKGMLIAVVVGILALGGGAVALLGGGSKPDADANLVKPAEPVAAAPAAPVQPAPIVAPEPTPPAAAVEEVKITLLSEPDGAEVYRGDALMGTTPFVLVRPHGSDSVSLSVKKEGYDAKSVLVSAMTTGDIKIALDKVEKKEHRSSGGSRPSAARPTPAPAPTPGKPAAGGGKRSGTEVLDPWD